MSGVLGQAAPLHLRLLVENVEVPVIGAFVSAQEGSPATAQVEVVPANSGLGLAARSKVLLFWLDPGDVELGRLHAPKDWPTASVGMARALTDAGYKLLFSGELFSMTYSKSGTGSRSLLLQCLDDSNNWDTSYLYTLQYSSEGQESITAGDRRAFLALNVGGANTLDDVLNNPIEVIRQIANRQRAISKSISGPPGLLGGLLGILELIGGVSGKFVGITAWHTIQEARVRLIDQIGTDSGATAAQLFDVTAFENWLIDHFSDRGTVISFRELIGMICAYIYYSVVPNPVGVYRAGERTPPVWPPGAVEDLLDGAGTEGLHPEMVRWRDRILTKLQERGWNGTTPAKPMAIAGSAFRTTVQQQTLMKGTSSKAFDSRHLHGFAQDFKLQGTGFGFTYGRDPDPDGSFHARLEYWSEEETKKAPGAPPGTVLSAVYKHLMDTPDDKAAATRAHLLSGYYRDIGEVVAELQKNEGAPISWGGRYSRSSAWAALYGMGGDPVHVELHPVPTKTEPEVQGAGTSPADLAGAYTGIADRERLVTQVFRPDVWFVPPPACNVVFPEEVTNLTFTRDMMRETTRLQLTTYNAVVGDDSVINELYFAPQIEGTESLTSQGLGSASRALIYPHEKLPGIIPKMERMSDLSFYARLPQPPAAAPDFVGPAQALPASSTAPAATKPEAKFADPAPDALAEWASSAALFTYLSYRYSARSLSATLKFTPRLVCGFPALVIDRTAPEGSTPEERAKSAFSPNHFLGMVRSLSHSLSQSGGSTSVTLSHVRTHKTDVDDAFTSMLYGKKGIVSGQKKFEEVTTVVKVNDNMSPDDYAFAVRLFDRMYPHRLEGRVEGVLGPPDMDPAAPSGLSGPRGGEIVGAITVELPRPVGFNSEPAPSTSGSVQALGREDVRLGRETRSESFPFSQVTVTEKGAMSFLPLEEAIRPPWVDDEYSNAKIGELYKKLFGCPSIMDVYKLEPGSLKGVPFSMPGITEATEKIVDHYSKISQGGYLGASYIREVTNRDYATLDQVVGTAAHPGFFWESSGDYDGLKSPQFAWMTKKMETTPAGTTAPVSLPSTQMNPTEDNSISPVLDPRKERWERALAYRDELLRSAGQRG